MRHLPTITLWSALLASCAVEPELSVPDEPIDVGKGDGPSKPSPHFQAVTACDDALAETGTTAEGLATYWECLLTANSDAVDVLEPELDVGLPSEHEAIEKDFDEMCKAAGLRSTDPERVAPICGVSLTRQLSSLFDAFAKFGSFDRVANDPDQTFTQACYTAYSAAIVNATTDVQHAEISSRLNSCVRGKVDEVLAMKIKPGLVSAGASEAEIDLVAAAFQHLRNSAGNLCSSFGQTLSPLPGSLAFRLSIKDRCSADMLTGALGSLAFFHDKFADRVPTRLEFSATPNQAIPDGADRGIDVDIPVTGVAAPKALTVAIDISHSFPADLVVEISKDGRLIKRLLDHDEDTPFPLRTSYSFTAAEVGDPNGKWTLRVADPWEDDTGKINSVTLSFE